LRGWPVWGFLEEGPFIFGTSGVYISFVDVLPHFSRNKQRRFIVLFYGGD
jgi:hypothetical protein